MSVRKILIAVDGSKPSTNAVNWYFQNMKRDNDEVILLHTPEYRVPIGLPGMAADVNAITKGMKEESKRIESMMAPYMKQLRDEKVRSHQLVQPGQKPGEAIIKAAEDEGVNSIVMGSRGLGKLRRTLLGSVSDYVTQHAPAKCTVTIVRDFS